MKDIITTYSELKKELEGKIIPEFNLEFKERYKYNEQYGDEFKERVIYRKNNTLKQTRKELKRYKNNYANRASVKIIDIILDNKQLLEKVEFVYDRSHFTISALIGYRICDGHISIDKPTIQDMIDVYIRNSFYPIIKLSVEEQLDLISNHHEKFYVCLVYPEGDCV